ncbi:MAG: ABC transporter substrate-binding protein [Candidatus Thermoplasmatota archaeon]
MLVTVLSAFAVATPAAAAAAEEDVFYIAMQADLTDFNNYNLGSNSVWKAHVISYCYEGLASTDYDLSTFPLLATGWTFDEDTLTVDVSVRQDVLFHDGTTMTVDDVIYSYRMARDGTTYSDRIVQAFDIDEDGSVDTAEFDASVIRVDDETVRFIMARPYGQFFSSTLSVPIVPQAIWDDDISGLGFTDVDDKVIVTVSDPLMLIGTGAFMYDSGVDNSHRVIATFPDYWGKDEMSPAGMPLFPKVLDKVYYKIYTSIDTAILALQGGDVDYIAWAVTAGRVPSLQSDPNIQLEYMSDAGYFYLAFNMKKEPMNNLTFRKAVSHLIDKDQIVDVYMGGFGTPGSAAVSPFFGEWHNPAVTKYAFDMDIANDLLDDAGYIDSNGDGWRDMPDGSLMDKITLMTPPADYDPIRIKAGEMLSTNMRAAGINVEAKPIDFNTLVAKLTAFDYQMLELGWSFTGYTECVSVLFDIYGPMASSNSWAFWSPTHENPWYAELGGVSTLADEATIALADEFFEIEQDARASFITADQIDLTKQGQEIIAQAIPCNVLYYRVNVEAHNRAWTNWTQFDGTLMNGFNLAMLDYAGAGETSGGGAVTDVSAGLTLPGKVRSGETVEATVVVIDNLGDVVEGATVAVNVTGGGVTVAPASGTTDAAGVFTFDVTGTEIGESTVRADVTMGTSSDSDSAMIRTYTKGGLGVVVTPDQTSVVAGETIDVTCFVGNADGPVEGAEVMIDKYLLGYGTIDPEIATTGADGTVVMQYTAPEADLLNQHMLVSISASVSMEGYLYTNVASAGLVVYNDDAPDWMLVSVDSVTTTALSPTTDSATITVSLTDVEGTAIGSETLDVVYSDEAMVVSPDFEITTAADGTADLTVTMDDTGASGALRVTIGKLTEPNVIEDTVTFTYVDPADPPAAPMFGGYAQYATSKFIDALGSVDLTFHVFDSDGVAADGVTGSVLVAATDYGQMTDWSGSEYNTLWDYAGMNILTDADGVNIVSAGSYSAPEYLDGWVWDDDVGDYVALDAQGVDIVAGVYDMTIEGVDLAHLDQALMVYLCPDSTADFDWNTYNHVIMGQTTISSSYGYGRSMAFTAVRWEIADPVLQAKTSDFDTTTLDMWVYDENNDLVEGAEAAAYQANWRYFGLSPDSTIATGADGAAEWEIICAAYNTTSGEYDIPVYETVPILYMRAYVDGTISLLSQTKLVFEPIVRVAFGSFEAVVTPQPLGFVSTVTATVVDLNGDPVAGLPVTIATSGGMAFNAEAVTADDGTVTFALDTSEVSDVAAAFVAVELTTEGTYEASGARAMVAMVNKAPTVAVAVPADDQEVAGTNATVLGSVYDMNGLSEATLTVDGGTPIDLLDEAGATVVAIEEVLEDLAEGEHTVVVSATDSLGQESEVSVTFTLVAEEEAETDMLPWIVAIAMLVVAVVLAVLLLMKMRKPAAPAEEAEAPEEKPEA